jgi:hypothetical protein
MPQSIIETTTPFTDAEESIMELLVQAEREFIQLPDQNKFAVSDFNHHVKHLQRILAMRPFKRLFPDYQIHQID